MTFIQIFHNQIVSLTSGKYAPWFAKGSRLLGEPRGYDPSVAGRGFMPRSDTLGGGAKKELSFIVLNPLRPLGQSRGKSVGVSGEVGGREADEIGRPLEGETRSGSPSKLTAPVKISNLRASRQRENRADEVPEVSGGESGDPEVLRRMWNPNSGTCSGFSAIRLASPGFWSAIKYRASSSSGRMPIRRCPRSWTPGSARLVCRPLLETGEACSFRSIDRGLREVLSFNGMPASGLDN